MTIRRSSAIFDYAKQFLGLRWRIEGLGCSFEFRVDLIHCFEDIATSIFLTFGLKLSNHAHFLMVLEGFDNLNNFIIETPKVLSWVNPRILRYRS